MVIQIPRSEIEFTFTRSSGPGGQNVNKVNSKAVLRWNPVTSASLSEDVRARFIARFGVKLTTEGDLVIASDRFRDREKNIADCLAKLQAMIDQIALPPKPRKPSRPSRGAKRRRVENKRRLSLKKNSRRTRPED